MNCSQIVKHFHLLRHPNSKNIIEIEPENYHSSIIPIAIDHNCHVIIFTSTSISHMNEKNNQIEVEPLFGTKVEGLNSSINQIIGNNCYDLLIINDRCNINIIDVIYGAKTSIKNHQFNYIIINWNIERYSLISSTQMLVFLRGIGMDLYIVKKNYSIIPLIMTDLCYYSHVVILCHLHDDNNFSKSS